LSLQVKLLAQEVALLRQKLAAQSAAERDGGDPPAQ
jgi:hypothetical protein